MLGAADGAFLLHKEKRVGNAAALETSGCDQQDQKLYLVRNTEKLSWDLECTETELWKEPPEPLLETISEIVNAENSLWEGSPTQLAESLKADMPPNALTRKLNVNAGRLCNEYGINYTNKHTHGGRLIGLHTQTRDDVRRLRRYL